MLEKSTMPSLLSKENWLKGVIGLAVVTESLVPTLKRHYLQKAKEWNTDDDHLNHLLDLGAAKRVKQVKTEGSTWYVNCSKCRSILEMIEKAHCRPARLTWMNNQSDDSCPSEYRLAKIFMPGGNEKTEDYRDLDVLAVLEILRNDINFGHSYNEILYLILFRNRLMHSSSNCISPDDLEAAFSQMKNLLQEHKFKNLGECITAVEELDQLLKKKVICDLDEYSKNWKVAITIQKQALKSEGLETFGSKEMYLLLTQMEVELQKENMKTLKLKSMLSKSEEQRENEQRQRKLEDETNKKRLESQLDDTKNKYEAEMQNLHAEKDELQEKVDKLLNHDPTISGRIIKGSMTGSGVGLAGGPVGSLIGAAAGGVVGAVSFFWDRLKK